MWIIFLLLTSRSSRKSGFSRRSIAGLRRQIVALLCWCALRQRERYVLHAGIDCRTSPHKCSSRFRAWRLKTGSSSPGVLEITLRTSEVAVCCFSIGKIISALTQLVEQPRILYSDDRLVGKVVTSSICLSVKGRTSLRNTAIAPIS